MNMAKVGTVSRAASLPGCFLKINIINKLRNTSYTLCEVLESNG